MNDLNYILMLERDSDDKNTTRSIFLEKGFLIPVTFLEYSNELFPFLDRCNSKGNMPAIILISIRAIPDDGLTVLKKLKEHPDYGYIPVIMLSERTSHAVINTCYTLGASSVIQKPFSQEETIKKIETFVKYWFEVVQLPGFDRRHVTNSADTFNR